MRFLQDGPSIPDDLLLARDEGRVVFFCGSGVSRARAGLPDFLELADAVVRSLAVPTDDPACRILREVQEIEGRTGVGGLIPIDRIFALLERDFFAWDVEAAVADALRPADGVNLSAHRLLLKLAKTPDGRVQLITTNFDRLFEDCDCSLPHWQPPRLPDPSRARELHGIIHLHGRAAEDYCGPEGDGFVLATSQFGRAYLSDRWATDFFKAIVSRYVVVFLGYSAEDPPIQYLLEALNKEVGYLNAYALQAGNQNEASARWNHKGIRAIAYPETEGHSALWNTLEAWTQRASGPEDWCKAVVELARRGPEQLQPYERGQVAHVVSTGSGARWFADGHTLPPADWLCVFDPQRRYATPGRARGFGTQGSYVDPFELYGLDSDVVPRKTDPEGPQEEREVPSEAWDCFALSQSDRQSLRDNSLPSVRGPSAPAASSLPPRLNQLGVWIAGVADQPASAWWAAYQGGLHPEIQWRIKWGLERSTTDAQSAMRQAWRYLFEAWSQGGGDFHRDWHELKAGIDKYGWDSASIRRYAAVHRPFIKAERNYWRAQQPPEGDVRVNDLALLTVEYPELLDDADIPDDWLALAVQELRKNLEHALYLESELGGHRLEIIRPIVAGDNPNQDAYGRSHGLSGSVVRFTSHFSRLVGLNSSAAGHELAIWPRNDDTIFCRLRIWAGGFPELVSAHEFVALVTELSDDAFWDRYHQRDLLLVLAKRWSDLSREGRGQIEARLLRGPPQRDEERRAWDSLERITWLANNGCEMTIDLGAETERLRSNAPDWYPEYAAQADESREGRSGWVSVETDYTLLIEVPLDSVLSKAQELGKREADQSFVRRDPFKGLSAACPVRAFRALTRAAAQGQYPPWAWSTFLAPDARKDDKADFSALIAERIARYPISEVATLLHPITFWLQNCSERLSASWSQAFDRLFTKLIDAMRHLPQEGETIVAHNGRGRDRTMEAINAPAGHLAMALFDDSRTKGLVAGNELPYEWRAHLNALLALPHELRGHALVVCAHYLNWLYTFDRPWTEDNLLSAMGGDDENDRMAAWGGFLWGANVSNQELYACLKPSILSFAKKYGTSLSGYSEVLVQIVLVGWCAFFDEEGARRVSNDELRDVLLHTDEEFRLRIPWQANNRSEGSDDDAEREPPDVFLELIRDVWPRQRSARSPRILARLCDLTFSREQFFLERAEVIIPFLTKIEGDTQASLGLVDVEDHVVDRHPSEALAILHAALPGDASVWPYRIESVLQRIGEADSELKSDDRLVELRRKWDSR